jgi:catechol 2,3-dioxygenase-like lactoylglutathione lyase family enzyme
MQLRWSHAVVYVRDLDDMLDFYTGVLGFQVTDRGPLGHPKGPEIVFMSQVETDHHQLAFLPVRKGEENSNSVNHFAFRLDSLDEIKAMHERLTADGRATEINPLTHGNAWSVYFSDPEGNGIELFCDSPWHVTQPQVRPWDIEKPNDEVVKATRAEFQKEPGFGPIDEFYAARKAALTEAGILSEL